MERKVIVIAGPTCSGKTTLSLILAKKLSTEIISADSRQFYRMLNIGTAKPDTNILNEIKHHFIDTLDPDDYFNISKFEKQAMAVIEDLFAQNKVPIVVGGSGLYIKALTDGIIDITDTPNVIKDIIQDRFLEEGLEGLFNQLKEIDPESASKMPGNRKRIIRSLEVYFTTGKTLSQHHKEQSKAKNETVAFSLYGLEWPRDILYSNIEKRVDEMISAGLVNEVEKILSSGYKKELNSLNTVGYEEIIDYLDNKITLDRAIELIKRNTRRYAKRQLTWFRHVPEIKWFTINSSDDLRSAAEIILTTEGLNER